MDFLGSDVEKLQADVDVLTSQVIGLRSRIEYLESIIRRIPSSILQAVETDATEDEDMEESDDDNLLNRRFFMETLNNLSF